MFFSVIVPVYNVEKYLKECVDSVLEQTFTDFELILVDDGSKDNSGKICDEYQNIDARVKVIHKENGGQSTARNCGVAKAQGKYAIFLDSDDFIACNHFFADLYAKINDNTDVVVFRYNKYYSKDRIDDCNIQLKDINYKNKGEFLSSLVKRDAFFCSCWSKCTSLSLIKRYGVQFDETLNCEDMDWYYSVVSHAENFEILDCAYINYRQRENSVTTTFKQKTFDDYIRTIDKWYLIFLNMQDGVEKSALLSSLAKLYCNLLISYSAHRKQLKAFKKKIFAYKKLLTHNLNPRTKKIRRISRIFGLNLTCVALSLLYKARR